MKANEFFKKVGVEAVKSYIAAYEDHLTDDLKRLVESWELVEKLGGLERVKKAINGKHISYTHFYLHSNNSYVFLDHYVDFIPDHAQHIGMFNKAIADVESCQ